MPSAAGIRYLEALPAPNARPRGALILLHAFPLNARMWEGQFALAGRGRHVVAPHVRGADGGTSDRPTAAVTMDDYAADLVDLLDALHIEDAVLCGLSMGGYLALSLLRHAPNYIRAIVLADTKSQGDSPEALEGRRNMLSLVVPGDGAPGAVRGEGAPGVETTGVAAVADVMIPKLLGGTTQAQNPDLVKRVRALILSNGEDAVAGSIRALMSRSDTTSLLGSLRIPALVIVGEEDTVTPPAVAEQLKAGIPGAELVRIPGAGHLTNLERPDAFNAALAHFLDHRV